MTYTFENLVLVNYGGENNPNSVYLEGRIIFEGSKYNIFPHSIVVEKPIAKNVIPEVIVYVEDAPSTSNTVKFKNVYLGELSLTAENDKCIIHVSEVRNRTPNQNPQPETTGVERRNKRPL